MNCGGCGGKQLLLFGVAKDCLRTFSSSFKFKFNDNF